jgi:hypothetical protein
VPAKALALQKSMAKSHANVNCCLSSSRREHRRLLFRCVSIDVCFS